mmetsp:Transcript_1150/g.2505  ORF Transcript_1150/g.2505 Transcript_1150/m.2505 type:complete len:211 (+) Transcript_1150:2936-3568(+)
MQSVAFQCGRNGVEHFWSQPKTWGKGQCGGTRRQSSLDVQLNSSVNVAFGLLELRGAFLLVGLHQPLVVAGLERFSLGVIFALGDLDCFVPAVQLLIHLHGLLSLALFKQQNFGTLELPIEHCHAGLHRKVRVPIATNLCRRLLRQFIHLVEVAGLANIAKGCETALCNEDALVLERKVTQRLPECFSLRRKLKLLQQEHCAFVVPLVDT